MTNEEKILKLLEQMNGRLDKLEDGQKQMNGRLEDLETEMSSMKSEMNERFDSLEASMKFAWQDIALVESKVDERIKAHEELYHEAV